MELGMGDVVSVVLTDVQQTDNSITVMREITLNDGSVVSGKHVFPLDTLEWRAAEYGIDPADTETLIDIVIYEPFLDDPDDPGMLLYEAPSVDEARDYHLDRVRAVKDRTSTPARSARGFMEKKSGPDPIRERVKALSVINPEAIEIKQAFVNRGREEYRKTRESKTKDGLRSLFVQPVDPEVDRLKLLRANLSPRRPTATLQGVED